jgi:DHA1 family inner membrane transport protein
MPRLPLLALAVAAFAIGTTEFVIMGLLPDVARDLGVSIPQAGMLVSGYALGVTLGAPILAVLTAGLPRKTTLLTLMGVFLAGNVLCALAPGYGLLLAARIATAFAHGTFFGIAAVVAADLVPRQQRAQAISLVFTGLTLATVLGVPAGTALGQAAGWRATFWAVAGIGAMAMAAITLWLPREPAAGGRAGRRAWGMVREFGVLGQRQVVLAMLISTLSSVSLFTVFTYITPLLESVSGFSAAQVTWALLLFGVGLTIGNLLGGRLADWRLMPAMIGLFVALAGVLVAFAFASRSALPAIVVLTLWGVIAFALIAPLQMRVLDQASRAPNLASILNQGAFNLGNAAGAWVGGAALSLGLGFGALPFIAASVAVVALVLAVLAARSEAGPSGAPATAHSARLET